MECENDDPIDPNSFAGGCASCVLMATAVLVLLYLMNH